MTRSSLPPEVYRGLPRQLHSEARAFLARHPFESNVFVMMRYREERQYAQIESSLRIALFRHGLIAHVAKDSARVDQLWENIQLYMHCCKFGVAVFEQIDSRDFNPNLSLELGYMYAIGRRCLLLKDSRMPGLPSDVCGRLYRPFDILDIAASIDTQVESWARDIGVFAPSINSPIALAIISQVVIDDNPAKEALREMIERIAHDTLQGILDSRMNSTGDGS